MKPPHGGNIYRLAEALGKRERDIIDLSASINPLGLPPAVKAEMRNRQESLAHYPDPDAASFVKKVAEHHGVDSERVLAGNGSTELIYLIPRALRPRSVLIPEPTFSEYERACLLAGAGIKRLALGKEHGYRVVADEFIAAMRGADMAFLCNPNNPTGDASGREEALEIARAARRLKCLLMVDEAFVDFCPEESVIDVENPFLMVLRSMTKFYALSGLRLGYGVFPARLARHLRAHKEPWTVNTLAQRAGIAALGDRGFMARTYRLMKRERGFLEQGFNRLGIRYYPTRANFYLLRTANARAMVEGLLTKSIALRDCSNFRGLAPGHIRAAVRTRKENRMLLEGIGEFLG